jgi:hypothetical protein
MPATATPPSPMSASSAVHGERPVAAGVEEPRSEGREGEREPRRAEPSVVLPLVGILLAIAVPVSFAVLSAAGVGILAVVFGILATIGILLGLGFAMVRIIGSDG